MPLFETVIGLISNEIYLIGYNTWFQNTFIPDMVLFLKFSLYLDLQRYRYGLNAIFKAKSQTV